MLKDTLLREDLDGSHALERHTLLEGLLQAAAELFSRSIDTWVCNWP